MRTIAIGALLLLAPAALAQEQPRAFLGVQVDVAGLSDETRAVYGIPADVKEGVIISEIVPESAAARAGLRRGDVLVDFDGKPVKAYEDLVAAIQAHEPGDKTSYTVRRGPGTIHGILTLGKWEAPIAEEKRVIVEEELEGRDEDLDNRLDRVRKQLEELRHAAEARRRGLHGLEAWLHREEVALEEARKSGDEKAIHVHEIRLDLLRELKRAGVRVPDRRLERIERKLDAILELLKKRSR